LREQQDELDRLGARVVAVSFESRARMRDFQRREPLPFPLLRDPRRAAYRAFGFERRSLATVWGPRTLWYYVRRLLQGQRLPLTRGDPYQLGGDVVVRAGHRAGWRYPSAHPADRPRVASIMALLERTRHGEPAAS
jgi:hypothetical protein